MGSASSIARGGVRAPSRHF